jgi:two-component system response regulator AtoC
MKVLLIDPEPESRDALRRAFQAAGAQVRVVATIPEGEKHLTELQPDVVVGSLDSSGEGLGFLLSAIDADSRRVAYALVDRDRLEDGAEAMSRGIRDFVWRPVSQARVAVLLARLSERREQEARAERLRLELAKKEMEASLVGSSASWKATVAAIEREAALESPVLLTGELGTEKEQAALSLHRLSRRGSEPLLRVFEMRDLVSQLDSPGALFVPAVERAGRLVQERLLGVLENPRAPRLIVASDEEPQEAVAAGRLLAPLLDALREHVVHLPPLRERGDDVDLLARRLLGEIDPTLFFDAEARDALSAHDWPGNVAELAQVVRRASLLSDGSAIRPTVVLSVIGGPAATRRARRRKPPVVRVPVGASLADVERRLIQKTLQFVRGNKPKAAQLLKLSLKTIYNKIKEYGIEH